MNAIAKLTGRMQEANSLVCCGLDPDLTQIPDEVTGSDAERVYRFLSGVIQVAAPNVCAFKAQKAFFDSLDGGHEILAEIVRDVHRDHSNVPVFIDCKIGDIDNTMVAYTDFLLAKIDADGILINPYMGDEVLEAFDNYPDKAVIVLARTSNHGAAVVQDALMADGRPLWQYILRLIVERWNKNGNLIPVISSTANLDLQIIRRMIPNEMPILLAGVGAQGGDYSALKALLDTSDSGVFVNSSRGLLYPTNSAGRSWQEAVTHAVVDLKEALNRTRREGHG